MGEQFTFDTTVSSETTVSGEYAGASLEEKLTTEVHSGFEKDESREDAESQEDTTGVAVEFECPAYGIKEVSIVKKHQREQVPVSGVFVVDFAMQLKLRHWWNKQAGGIHYRNSGQDYFNVDSVQGLYQLMRGVDTDYPHLAGFWQSRDAAQPEVVDGINHLLDVKNREYVLDVDKIRVIESAATYKHRDLAHPSYGSGEVINLSDEQNRIAYSKAA